MAENSGEKRKRRSAERDLKIPPVAEPARRQDCLSDTFLFLRTYFPSIFFQPFTPVRREMISAIVHVATYGGDQAIAGPRGDGKTRSALFAALHLSLAGQISFPLIVSKNATRAKRELKNLKDAITQAIRDDSPFAKDFPELCIPVADVGGWASRAIQQTAHGERCEMEWGGDVLVLPTITTELLREHDWDDGIESVANGQILASLGIEGAIRGFSVRNRRPDLAILDDLDDRESAGSETQTAERELIVEEDIAGLGGPDKSVSRVMLCTLINHSCVAATYTDAKKKPSWKGQRHKLLTRKPDNEQLSAEYVELRRNASEKDPDARVAHDFYLANREAIEAGGEVSNPYRFDKRKAADGSQREVSTFQHCLNIIADRGQRHFDTEYQNDPPADVGPIESGITARRIQRQLSGYSRRVIPPGCQYISQGIDVRKTGLHWVVRAWRPDATGYTVYYGERIVHGTRIGTDEGLDLALHRSIVEHMEDFRANPYADKHGNTLDSLTLVDAGWRTDAIYSACRSLGLGVSPAMGFGKSAGCTQANFSEVQRLDRDRQPGTGWFLSRRGNVWLVCMDADRWKAWEHDRWMTSPERPGALLLFGEPSIDSNTLSPDEKDHLTGQKRCQEPFIDFGSVFG